jgi:tripartite-type tricarboxylate transporter receptor subunit TctC
VELGYKDAEFYIWIGLFAPANTPDAIVQTLRTDIQKAVTMDNGFAQSMTKLGAVPDYRTAAAFDDFLNKDAERIKATLLRIGKVD